MMRNKIIVLVLFIFISFAGKSQDVKRIVEINDVSTTHIKFPSPVTYLDVGNSSIHVDYFDNIVKLKSKKKGFEKTSLLVITEDDMIFDSDLVYKSGQVDYVLNVPKYYMKEKYILKEDVIASDPIESDHKAVTSENLLSSDKDLRKIDHSTIEYIEDNISEKYDFYRVGTYEQGVFLSLRNIYVYKDFMIIRVSIENESNLTYTVDLENIFVKDRKRLKRAASQDISVPILARLVNDSFSEDDIKVNYNKSVANYTVGSKSKSEIVFVLDKFNSSRNKKLSVELSESGSERRLTLDIPMRFIKKAKLL